jgi:type IV secretory pathway VirB2 component (pilin)
MTINTLTAVANVTVARRLAKSTSQFVVAAFALALVMMPEVAWAGGAAPWETAADGVLAIFTGGLSRTIAIIAVIACGIAALAGKLSWDWAIKIIVGIVLIFGSAAFVDFIVAAV